MANIQIEEIYAYNDEVLKERLNEINGRIISVENIYGDVYKVIYEE